MVDQMVVGGGRHCLLKSLEETIEGQLSREDFALWRPLTKTFNNHKKMSTLVTTYTTSLLYNHLINQISLTHNMNLFYFFFNQLRIGSSEPFIGRE